MNKKVPFEVITDYCHQQNKNSCIRDLAFSIYRQQFESLTKDPSMDQINIDVVQTTLLSTGNLVAHIRSAEEILRKQFEDDIKPIKAQATMDSFWFAVVTGIVSNIIYSLLIIILFIVAKDQLASWLSSLVQNKP